MMQTLLAYLVLPGEVSQFEREYLARMNRIGLWFFALHVPALSVLAFFNGQSPVLAVVLTSLLVLGPILAMRSLQNPRSVSLVYGFTSMLMGGLLVHFGQGPVQIEMHFYFFALLAMLAVYANPMAIVVAAVTVAVHHLALWMYLPKSVFNYAAPFWVVLVHAGFVVAESVATCFIARSFFDNVIGLDKIVQARTRQLDARNSDMRLVLDHVNQGFFTIDRGMAMSSEQSRVLGEWFGSTEPNMPFSAYLDRAAPGFAERFSMAWDAVIEDVLPLALTLDQLPKRVDVGLKHFGLEYTPIMENAALAKVLVMISDITADVERERLEAEQRDVLNILRRVAVDRLGVVEFLAEANDLMTLVRDPKVVDTVTLKRAIHTLKGNAMIFGVQSIAEPCHALESKLDEGEALTLDERTQLGQGWARLCGGVEQLLGTQEKRRLEIDDEQYEAIMHAVLRGEVEAGAHDRALEPCRRASAGHRQALEPRGLDGRDRRQRRALGSQSLGTFLVRVRACGSERHRPRHRAGRPALCARKTHGRSDQAANARRRRCVRGGDRGRWARHRLGGRGTQGSKSWASARHGCRADRGLVRGRPFDQVRDHRVLGARRGSRCASSGVPGARRRPARAYRARSRHVHGIPLPARARAQARLAARGELVTSTPSANTSRPRPGTCRPRSAGGKSDRRAWRGPACRSRLRGRAWPPHRAKCAAGYGGGS
jgi:HPt (histidine-containing phosphotransfer) domain-containing protein